MEHFNYGQAQISKLDPKAEWRLKLNASDNSYYAETHWMRLTENQKQLIAALIIEFNTNNSK